MNTWLSLALCAAVTWAGAPPSARAAGGDNAQVAPWADKLANPDPAQVTAAIDALGALRDREARSALAAFLRAGQPDALADRALLALGKQPAPEELGLFTEFTRHRRPAARVLAFTAVARIPLPAADDLLGAGLRDSDPGVRALCARRLGERVAYRQLDLLFRALERGLPDAAFAIGRIADAGNVARFAQQLGRLPIGTMLPGYEQLLLRTDLAEAQKLELIAQLGEVASPSVKSFLQQLRRQPALANQPRVLFALAETGKRIAPVPSPNGSGKPAPGAAQTPPTPPRTGGAP